jgi:two-component system, sensor histidine kinase PdtaS
MTISIETQSRHRRGHTASGGAGDLGFEAEISSALAAALHREEALLHDKARLLEQQALLAQEFEHRLANSLQLVSSLLSLQARAAATAETAMQLSAASTRVAAIGRVHRRLHLLDHENDVAFKTYMLELCADLSGLLLQEQGSRAVVVSGADVQLPVAFAIPLGFIVNELVTNSVKYTSGSIDVLLASEGAVHSLSVSDEGPGLPMNFDPADSKGLGMNITRSLVKQIGGSLHFSRGGHDRGTCVSVNFRP